MSKNTKRYVLSSIITFIASFCAAVLPSVGDLEFSRAALVALVLVGVRAGVKAILEFIVKVTSTPLQLDELGE